MKKAIVTGATGFVGAHLVKTLSEHAVEVYALCRKESPAISRICSLPNVKIIEGAFDSADSFLNEIPDKDIDVFYHLAWGNATGLLRQSLSAQIKNVNIIETIVEMIRRLECKKIVVAGTVYEKLYTRVDSANTFMRSSYYLQCKRFLHSILKQFACELGIEFVWCNFFHPIGKYNKLDQIIAATISKLINGETPSFGNGQNLFDVIAVEDLAMAFYIAGKTELKRKEYYIGSGNPQKFRHYIERVGEIVMPGCELLFDVFPDDGMQIAYEWIDSSEFCVETGFVPKIDYDSAVMQTLEWVLQNKSK